MHSTSHLKCLALEPNETWIKNNTMHQKTKSHGVPRLTTHFSIWKSGLDIDSGGKDVHAWEKGKATGVYHWGHVGEE